MLRGNMGRTEISRGRRKRLARAASENRARLLPGQAKRRRDEHKANLVVRVLAALVLGQIAHAFQFREFGQQLLFDTVFQGDINH